MSSPQRSLFDSLLAPWDYLALIAGFLIWGVGGLIYTGVSAVLYPILPRRAGSRLGQCVMTGLFQFFVTYLRCTGRFRLDLSELDRLRGQGGLILAPNHPSLLDAVWVIARLSNVTCIMKAKIWDNIFLGGGARLSGYIRNDSPNSMVKQGADALRSGLNLLVFPEGTRTVAGRAVNPFKGGFALIAKSARAPVQTIFLETKQQFLTKERGPAARPDFPYTLKVRLGERFEIGEDESVKDFVARLEDYYRGQLAVLGGGGM